MNLHKIPHITGVLWKNQEIPKYVKHGDGSFNDLEHLHSTKKMTIWLTPRMQLWITFPGAASVVSPVSTVSTLLFVTPK